MQSWKNVMLLTAALVSAGCGGDKGQETDKQVDPATASDAGTRDQDSDNGRGSLRVPDAGSAGGKEFPDCPRNTIPSSLPEYTGEAVWTLADYDSCVEQCGADYACWDTNCPGSAEFNDCVSVQAFGCSGSTSGGCRAAYETSICCAIDSSCSSGDDSCITSRCGEYIEAFINCAAADTTCAAAVQKCLIPDAATETATRALRQGLPGMSWDMQRSVRSALLRAIPSL